MGVLAPSFKCYKIGRALSSSVTASPLNFGKTLHVLTTHVTPPTPNDFLNLYAFLLITCLWSHLRIVYMKQDPNSSSFVGRRLLLLAVYAYLCYIVYSASSFPSFPALLIRLSKKAISTPWNTQSSPTAANSGYSAFCKKGS